MREADTMTYAEDQPVLDSILSREEQRAIVWVALGCDFVRMAAEVRYQQPTPETHLNLSRMIATAREHGVTDQQISEVIAEARRSHGGRHT